MDVRRKRRATARPDLVMSHSHSDPDRERCYPAEDAVMEGEIEAVLRCKRERRQSRCARENQKNRADDAAACDRKVNREQQAQKKLDADKPRRAVPR